MKSTLKTWQTLGCTLPTERQRSQPASRSLYHQQRPYAYQAQIDVPQKGFATHAMINHSAHKNRHQRGWQRYQIIMCHRRNPQSGEPITGHSNDAGGQKISLQGRAKMLSRPASHRSINHQGWAIHSVGSAEHARAESTNPKPCSIVALQF